MTDLRKLSEAATPGLMVYRAGGPAVEVTPEDEQYICALWNEHRSGSLIPRSEYERVLALLAEARDRLHHAPITGQFGSGMSEYARMAEALWNWQDGNRATLSRIDDALAAEREARG